MIIAQLFAPLLLVRTVNSAGINFPLVTNGKVESIGNRKTGDDSTTITTVASSSIRVEITSTLTIPPNVDGPTRREPAIPAPQGFLGLSPYIIDTTDEKSTDIPFSVDGPTPREPAIPNPQGFLGLSPYIDATDEKSSSGTPSLLPESDNVLIGSVTKELDFNRPTTEHELKLCGYPSFLNEQKCHYNATISSCTNYSKAVTFGVIIALFAVIIIGINAIIPVLVFTNIGLRTHHYFIKASLAVADSIVGFLLLFSVVPNIAWMMKISEKTLIYFPKEDENSTNAIVVGAILTVSTTASLFHLMFLSIERFSAIQWPFRHMRRKTRSVVYVISILWVAAVVSSFVPAAFPDYFTYQFQPVLLIHMMTLKPVNGPGSTWRGPLYGAVTILIPYMIMVVFCVATVLTSYYKIKKSARKFGKRSDTPHHGGSRDSQQKGEGRIKPEFQVFITLGVMILAFTVTLVPFTIVMILVMAGFLDCHNYTIPYVTLFYLGLFNSLANGIIYSVRDPKLIKAAKNIFNRQVYSRPVTTESSVTHTTRK